MQVQNTSVSNVYSMNNYNKVSNQPSFGAMRSEVADLFIKKAQSLKPDSRNEVLEKILLFAQRAKKSLVLDVGLTKNLRTGTTELCFIDANKRIYDTPVGELMDFSANSMGEITASVDGKVADSFKYSPSGSKPHFEAPVETFMEILMASFDATEKKVIAKMNADERAESLIGAINAAIGSE